MLYIAHAEKLGKKDAIEDRAVMISGEKTQIRKRNMVFATIERKVQGAPAKESGYLFSCSEKACFLFEKKTGSNQKSGKDVLQTVTRYVPFDQIVTFEVDTEQ